MTDSTKDRPEAIRADVLVVGGGLVGGTLACALADTGISSAVVDVADPASVVAAAFDGRASAISLTSRRLFEAVGLWPAMAPDACPMLDIRVSDADSPLFLHYDHDEIGDEPFGHMVENRVLRRAIFAGLAGRPDVRR